jgi:multidrug efflux pump subunit AcrA (membrane-fusion protein)
MGVRVAFLDGTPGAGGAGSRIGGAAALPPAAVQSSGAAGVVFVIHNSTVERRAVKLGAADSERVVVLAGVTPGERVAVGDFTQLKNGAEIHIEP